VKAQGLHSISFSRAVPVHRAVFLAAPLGGVYVFAGLMGLLWLSTDSADECGDAHKSSSSICPHAQRLLLQPPDRTFPPASG
jgi:hypothetical protein